MKHQISTEEKEYGEKVLVETVKCKTPSTPDYLIGVKDNCLVKIAPAEVENPVTGTATLVAGTVAVANTSITASSVIVPIRTVSAGTVGHITITKNAGVGFSINSSSNTDTSTFNWVILA